jgi:hypothetical protein
MVKITGISKEREPATLASSIQFHLQHRPQSGWSNGRRVRFHRESFSWEIWQEKTTSVISTRMQEKNPPQPTTLQLLRKSLVKFVIPSTALTFAALVIATFPNPLRGATFTVTVFTDSSSGGLAGTGAGAAGELRTQILAANLAGGTNAIAFTCSSTPCTITLTGPLPPITSNVTIDGGTLGNIVIDGAGLYRVFFVDTGTVALSNLTIQNGSAQAGTGGSGDGGGGGGAGLGGGLFVNQASAAVTLTNVRFVNCSAVGGSGGNFVSHAYAGGGGGGLAFPGGLSSGGGAGPGGGGVQGQGTDPINSPSGGVGGTGGGGGGGDEGGGGSPGTGGAAYATNSAGSSSTGINGGEGGFGGGGGGGAFGSGGAGGFGGGGGGSGSSVAAANGGPGGGGGGTDGGTSGQGGSLGSDMSGGNAGSGTGAGGGGAAAGPAVFINAGSLVVVNSSATGSTATAGAGGTASVGGTAGTAGTASSLSVFNYAGTVNASSTLGPLTLLDAISTSVSGSATPSSVTLGQTVTLSATVTTSSGTLSGTVTFLDGSTQLGSPVSINGSGTATLNSVSLTLGNHTITANFTSGDMVHQNSSTTFSAMMMLQVPSITVPAVSGSLVYGQSRTFSVTITGAGTPSGQVVFLDGSASLGAVSLVSGVASFSTSTMAAGPHSITAQYAGDPSSSQATSTALSVTITPATLTVTANNASKLYGAALPSFSAGITGYVNGDN